MLTGYEWTLRAIVLRYRMPALIVTVLISVALVYLFKEIPKGFIPSQDQNYFRIFTMVEDKTSFRDMAHRQSILEDIMLKSPDMKDATTVSLMGRSVKTRDLSLSACRPLVSGTIPWTISSPA